MRSWLLVVTLLGLVSVDNIAAEPAKKSDIQVEEIPEEEVNQEEYDEEKKKDGLGGGFESKRLPDGILKEEIEEIKEAIDAGVEYLKKLQDEDGAFHIYEENNYRVGGQALVLLSLLKCGVDREDEVITKGREYLLKRYTMEESSMGGAFTYSTGVVLMFMEAYYTEKLGEKELEKARKKFEKAKAKAIKRGKEFTDVLETTRSLKPNGQDSSWIKKMVTRLETTQDSVTGTWAYPSPRPYGNVGQQGAWSNSLGYPMLGDLSNTQYALLGLKAASRMGVRAKNTDIYKKVAEFLISRQDTEGEKRMRWDIQPEEDPDKARYRRGKMEESGEYDQARGWGYPAAKENHVTTPSDKAKPIPRTGSMTTAALACLMIAKSELEIAKELKEGDELSEEINRSVWDGFAWLDAVWSVEGNPAMIPSMNQSRSQPQWHYYYLYGLERAGMFAARDFVGEHEWYPEGARLLLNEQWEDGSWAKQKNKSFFHKDDIAETCFALLFLKRATSTKGFKRVKAPVTGSRR